MLCASVSLWGEEKERNPLDIEISFWEGRMARDAGDPVSPVKFGAACIQKTRESGDLSYLAKAVTALETAIKIKPKNPEALNWLALACVQQHRFKEALDYAERASKQAPADGFPFGVMGDACVELGELDKAEQHYVRAMELAPEMFSLVRYAALQFLRGDTAGSLKFYKEALSDTRNKNRHSFNTAWCELQLGQMYFRIGKFAEAEELYQEALSRFPENYMPLDYMAELRGAQERYDEAIGLYEKAIALTPRPELYQALGDVLFLARKEDKAAEMHAKAGELYIASINQGNTLFFHHLAGFYCDSKKSPADAVRWARRDFDLRKSIYAHDCLAWALYQTGEFKEAEAEIKNALKAGTQDSHLFYHASMIYFRAGNVAASKDALKKAAEINPMYNKFHAHRN